MIFQTSQLKNRFRNSFLFVIQGILKYWKATFGQFLTDAFLFNNFNNNNEDNFYEVHFP